MHKTDLQYRETHRKTPLPSPVWIVCLLILMCVWAGFLLVMSFALDPANRRPKDVRVHTVIVAELELGNIEGHIFRADLVERTYDPALEDAPKAFNRVGVDSADDVFVRPMIGGPVRVAVGGKIVIDTAFIGRKQADFLGNHLAYERFGGRLGDARQNAGDDVALALYSTDDRHLAARPALDARLAAVAVMALAADVGFVNFDDAAKLHFRLNQGRTDFVAHGMCCAVRAEAHDALHLKGADALFAGQHQMHDAEPLAQGLIGVLKDRPGDDRKTIARRAAGGALRALPMPRARGQLIDLDIAATRANHASGPAASLEVRPASVLVREGRLELGDGHLVNRLRATLRHEILSACQGRMA